MTQATERFSNRVENYIRYRPKYPPAVLECLQTYCALTETALIADVGSGTGILTEMFLRNGNVVYAVEPNREMREAGESLLQQHTHFKSIAATAEATTLPKASIDFVTAGQAFHWFERDKAKAEFQRILKPQGWVVLVWNERHETSTPFSYDYEQLLRTYATDYNSVNHKLVHEEALSQFFNAGFRVNKFENSQQFDFEGLKGRLLSSSYAPEADHPQHEAMIKDLQKIFTDHQINGRINFLYDTNIYYGQLG